MRKTVLLALASAALLLGACNTMRGVGRDVQAAGRGLENLSSETQASITKSDRRN